MPRPDSAPDSTPDWARGWRVWGLILVVCIPVIAQGVLIARELRNWMPVWAWYPDPGYQYLLAGPSLVSGGAPALVYHPGTSFQWLVGAVEWLRYIVAGQGTFFEDVATRPEVYAQAWACAMGLLYVAALVAVAWRLFRHWGFWPSLVFQLMMLWGLPVIAGARYQLWPEALVVASSLVVIALLAPRLGKHGPDPSIPVVLALGAVCAIGSTAKVVFLPVVVLCVLALPWRRLGYFALALATGSLVILLPIHSRLPAMWHWFSTISRSPGRHGQVGDWHPLANLLDAHALIGGFLRFYLPLLVVVVVGTVVLAALQARGGAVSLRSSAALLAGLLLTALLAAKQSEVRDLVVLVPVLAALSAHLVLRAQQLTERPWGRQAIGAIACGLSAYLALHGVVHHLNFARAESSNTQAALADATLVDDLVATGSWGLGYHVWTQQNAVMFGSNDALMLGVEFSDDRMNPEISLAYPGALYFDHWYMSFQAIDGAGKLRYLHCLELQELLADGGLGIIVDNPAELAMSADGSAISLSDATATFEGPLPVGQYSAFRLTSLTCVP